MLPSADPGTRPAVVLLTDCAGARRHSFLSVNPLTAVRYRPQMAARPRTLPGAAAVGAQIATRWDADIVDADTVAA
jgi:hypothetical protein